MKGWPGLCFQQKYNIGFHLRWELLNGWHKHRHLPNHPHVDHHQKALWRKTEISSGLANKVLHYLLVQPEHLKQTFFVGQEHPAVYLFYQ